MNQPSSSGPGDEAVPREEQEVFDELAALCASPGYVHVIAFFSARDNYARFDRELTTEALAPLWSGKGLIRAELATLIGLLVKQPIDYRHPGPETLETYIGKTEHLCDELHKAMSAVWFKNLDIEAIAGRFDPFSTGAALREPIFYGGDSAYDFQYREFAERKYGKDDLWLTQHKGFDIKTAADVVDAIGELLNEKVTRTFNAQRNLAPDQWTMLPGFTFTPREVADRADVAIDRVKAVLDAFTIPVDHHNAQFTSLSALNIANAMPILKRSDVEFIVVHAYSLSEALYESPFYWMGADKPYAPAALKHRGDFTEQFAKERLEKVFGSAYVTVNANLGKSRRRILGEIDVLVIFGERALIIQAKAKRLTLEARKGNDSQIKDDFKKAVQDAYDQAFSCAEALLTSSVQVIKADGTAFDIPRVLTEIYPICIVADHYPALSFQARQFLTYKTTDKIKAPLVMDVFCLDTITEMLESPLHLLSYLNRRAGYVEKLMIMHEHTLLAYHLKRNLWIDDDVDMISLDDDIGVDLDVAMIVRRKGIAGKRSVDGILTRFRGRAVSDLIAGLEARPEPAAISLGMQLLRLSEDALSTLDKMLEEIFATARRDGCNHDATIAIGKASSGLTIHCNDRPDSAARLHLRNHCMLRKHVTKSDSWFGMVVQPADRSIRLLMKLQFPWKPDRHMDELAKGLVAGQPGSIVRGTSRATKTKIGRNSPCPCGSGKKYKNCCAPLRR